MFEQVRNSVMLTKLYTVVIGNGEQTWYLSQVKGPAEDDLVEGDYMTADYCLDHMTCHMFHW